LRSVELSDTTTIAQHNLEAESFVLGSVLLENDAILKILDILRPDSFYREAHRKIYRAMLELFDSNEPIDLITLTERLKKQELLEEVGGALYLATLLNTVPTAANVKHHAMIVREKEILRAITAVAHEMLQESITQGVNVRELLDSAERRIFELSKHQTDGCFASLRSLLKETFLAIEAAYENKKLITGLAIGLDDLDRYTLGFQPTDLIIVAGRPSLGKTAFATNVAVNVAVRQEKTVALFSLEMSKSQIAMRMICSEARVNSMRLRAGYISKEDWPRLTRAAGNLSEAGIYIDDTPGISAFDIKARARRLQKEHGLGLIIVDYLQLMRWRYETDSKHQEVTETCRALKELAKELEIPVIVLSQLNRAPEYRKDKVPQLSDLRESGAIEQDADVVLFLHSPESGDDEINLHEIIIGKQRNGPTATVKVCFLKEYGRFESFAPLQEPEIERKDLL
jgi:replicative DNA helicase